MVTQEVMVATVRELSREAAEIERQTQANKRQGAVSRRAPSAHRQWRLSVHSFVARLFRTA